MKEPVREFGHKGPVGVWSCQSCGPCITSRAAWCDLGCGRDYIKMEIMELWALPWGYSEECLKEWQEMIASPEESTPTEG